MNEDRKEALHIVRDELAKGVVAEKCHRCGCMQQAVAALTETSVGGAELGAQLSKAQEVFVPKEYNCLGCRVCFPATNVLFSP